MGHRTEIRVRYAETDQGGVVYHGNYLTYFEVGRSDMMRARGVPYGELERAGMFLAVVESHVRYRAPARYDELLVVDTEVSRLGRAGLRIETRILRETDQTLLADGWVRLAATDGDGRVVPLAPRLVEALSDPKSCNH